MSRPRSGQHKDAMHDAYTAMWEQRGLLVLSLVPCGNGAPDALVCNPWARPPRWALAEIKAAQGKLRKKQIEFQGLGWPVHVIRDTAGVLALARELLD